MPVYIQISLSSRTSSAFNANLSNDHAWTVSEKAGMNMNSEHLLFVSTTKVSIETESLIIDESTVISVVEYFQVKIYEILLIKYASITILCSIFTEIKATFL